MVASYDLQGGEIHAEIKEPPPDCPSSEVNQICYFFH